MKPLLKNGIYEEDGIVYWYLNDQLHREDGPAVEYEDGSKEWFLYNQLHRIDGPSIEWANGSKEWHFNNKLHRENGPAIEYSDGHHEWWLNGHELSEEEFNQWLTKKELNQKLQAELPNKHHEKKNKI